MKKVITIGLGYIGLPTSALIASNNISVHGVDINQKIVDTINAGKIHIVEPDLAEIVEKVVSTGFLKASTKPIVGDVYLIVVPTPFRGNHEPDISYIEDATKSVIPLLKKGDLFIIESTSPVGTTDKVQSMILKKRPDLKGEIYIAYCPERVLPGNIMYELVNNDRVIGGVDENSTSAAINFYKDFVKGKLHKTNAKTAEMCKLTENSSRDVQIAFANELSLICDKAGVNVWELIELANKHPRVNILQPGAGVGGHCIAVDPYFLTSHFPQESRLISLSREINNYKAFWCLEKIFNEISKYEKKFDEKPKIGICGLSFKPNIDDLRESPALFIASRIKKQYAENNLIFVEPNIKSHDTFNLSDFEYAQANCDIIFYLVAHDEFIERDKTKTKGIEITFVSILKQ